MADRQQVFVAYPARDQTLADGIIDAVRKANALPLPIRYEPWAFNDVAGGPLISPILGKIDEAPYVVADITYLNLNVVYEVGFTIGRGKRAFIVRNRVSVCGIWQWKCHFGPLSPAAIFGVSFFTERRSGVASVGPPAGKPTMTRTGRVG